MKMQAYAGTINAASSMAISSSAAWQQLNRQYNRSVISSASMTAQQHR